MSTMPPLSVQNAQKIVLEHIHTRASETVALDRAYGRVLAEDIVANRDQPPYDVSAMDGFALRSVDLNTDSTHLNIVEDIKAGDLPRKTIGRGQCARIMTGAPIPAGADAVIRVEDTLPLGSDRVDIRKSVSPGNDIRPRGEGIRNGETVLSAGTEITPGVIGVLATVKRSRMLVYGRPRVAILSTGDELEGLDEAFDPNKIPNSNSYALMAQVQALGIEPVLLGIARDDPIQLSEYLARGLEFDVLLVSGGSSVGVHDHVRPTLETLGVCMHFWRVDMRPGHPVAFGTLNTKIVFGLPGNPVSSMVCFEQFVLPALRKLMGHPRLFRRTMTAHSTRPIKTRPGRTEFIRVVLTHKITGSGTTTYLATSTGNQSSGALISMARADALLVVPAASGAIAEHATALVQLLDGSDFQDSPGFSE